MSGPAPLSLPFGVGSGRRAAVATRRRLYAARWLPHGPLFVAVAALGVAQLRHALGVGIAARWDADALLAASHGVMLGVSHGGPSAINGLFLFVMAFGLLMRSRLAWVIAVLAAAVSLLLILLVWPVIATRPLGLLAYNGALILALLGCGRWFSRSSLASATLFAVVSVASLLAYAVVGTYLMGGEFNPPISDLVSALYYATVTMSTVGYGDIVPRTTEARMFAISVMVLGIAVFATSVSALLVPLINRRMESLLAAKERIVQRSNHYIVVSDSALARNTYKELKARDLPATFIMARAPETAADNQDIVVGDASDLDVLRRAGAADAKAILALSHDDSENAFVVMAAKELSEAVKTVAAVNDARNMARVRRVRPDLIIAPQVLGGELLAMALSGEAVDSDQLMRQLLHVTV